MDGRDILIQMQEANEPKKKKKRPTIHTLNIFLPISTLCGFEMSDGVDPDKGAERKKVFFI